MFPLSPCAPWVKSVSILPFSFQNTEFPMPKPQPKKAAKKPAPKPKASKPAPKTGAKAKPAAKAKVKAKGTNNVPKGKTTKAVGKAVGKAVVIPRPQEMPKKPVKLTPFLKMQKQRLMALRDTILDSMAGVAKDTLRSRPEGSEASAFGMHSADAGSDAYDKDFALSLLSQEQDALYEIEEALRRVDLGTYGVCEMSGKQISHLRLEALPFARCTVECQAEIERTSAFNARASRSPRSSVSPKAKANPTAMPTNPKKHHPKHRKNNTPWHATSSSSNALRRKRRGNPSPATSPSATKEPQHTEPAREKEIQPESEAPHASPRNQVT